MNEPLETIIKRMKRSNHSETILVADFADDLVWNGEQRTEEELAQAVIDSMDEIIQTAQIIKGWAKGEPTHESPDRARCPEAQDHAGRPGVCDGTRESYPGHL